MLLHDTSSDLAGRRRLSLKVPRLTKPARVTDTYKFERIGASDTPQEEATAPSLIPSTLKGDGAYHRFETPTSKSPLGLQLEHLENVSPQHTQGSSWIL